MPKNRNYYIINGITMYRLVAAPVMVVLIFTGYFDIFKWLLPVSFFTDLIDGALARKFRVTSVFGSKLDSIGDDLTMLCGIIGAFVFKSEFISSQKIMVGILIALVVLQNAVALIRYRKMTSFHTYLANGAFAHLQRQAVPLKERDGVSIRVSDVSAPPAGRLPPSRPGR